MEAKTLYISENENIFERLESENIELDRRGRSNILSIAKKANNNFIGYYQFKSGEEYFKIFVYPKLFAQTDNTDSSLQKQFLDFLKEYYRLKIKYGEKVSTKPISGNITDLSLDAEKISGIMNVEDFMYLKYIDALLTVRNFFKRHKRQEYVSKGYSSQSVRHKIDLAANIKSIDKSVVHQIRKEPVSYSILASIALSVLKVFSRKKLTAVQDEKIVALTVSNRNILQKRFLLDKNFTMTMRELIAHKTVKLFSKNQEHRKLYQALLVLSGMERFENGSDSGKITKIDDTVSIFFNPADLYEWLVYDRLTEEYSNHTVMKAGLDTECERSYYLYNDNKVRAKKSSNPDFILLDGTGEHIVVDAKWKVPDTFVKIHYEDVAKLKRDCVLRGYSKAMLVYPSLPDGYEGVWHFDDDPSFLFELKECVI